MRIAIVAGEASGDQLGAHLIQALRKYDPHCIIEGVAGSKMQEQGAVSLFPMEKLSVMGLPLTKIPELWYLQKKLISYFIQNPPDVFIGIDAPDFNLNIEFALKKKGIPTVHYVSPSVWAWRRYRLKKIAKAVDAMLVLFPFEEKFYREKNIPAYFVGHPLASQIPLKNDIFQARKKCQLQAGKRYIALLPGSRMQEIHYLFPVFLQTAARLKTLYPDTEFITAQINSESEKQVKAYQQRYAPDLPLHFFQGRSHEVMQAADVILIASGTATLEAMLYKKPMVIAYRMPAFSFKIAKWLVKIPHVGLPNILAQKLIVPEFIQDEANIDNLTNALSDYLNSPEKVLVLEKAFLESHQKMQKNTDELASLAILSVLKGAK